MTRRYYVSDLSMTPGTVELTNSEAEHALRVMRVQVGDSITLFDGQGNESAAVIRELTRRTCLCDAESATAVNREASHRLHLAIALPKPDRAKEMTERLTELGVKTVIPITAERTQREPSESVLKKLRRAVIEACKQSGRNELMQILPPRSSEAFFVDPGPGARLIAHPDDASEPLPEIRVGSEIVAAIGPEGGWTQQEVVSAIDNGFQSFDLGKRVYRVETAAAAIAARWTEGPWPG